MNQEAHTKSGLKAMLFKRPLLPALGWTLAIFILCATPGQYIPSADWLELLSFDKFVHASLFFVLCALWFVPGFRTNKPGFYFVVVILLGLAYGASLEIMQARYFSNRSADWKDMVANGVGCLLALGLRRRIAGWLG